MRHFAPARTLFICLLVSACTAQAPLTQPTPPKPKPLVPTTTVTSPTTPTTPTTPSEPEAPSLIAALWGDLPEWSNAELEGSWTSLQQSCRVLQKKPEWSSICQQASELKKPDSAKIRAFFEQRFTPWKTIQADGSDSGLVTGYYEPRLKGSLTQSAEFPYGIYATPDDLITVDLASIFPQLKGQRVRGRLEGKKLVPYYNRAELVQLNYAPLNGKALAWVADPVELAFLQIQGSGRIELPDGKLLRVGYADQNGHPWKSMARWLIDRNEMQLSQASMQSIQAWTRANPSRINELLAADPSFVFFRILPDNTGGPLGALGVPITDGYSVAIDPKYIPLGAPLYLSTSWPADTTPLNRLVMAQDTGGAIRGPVRADFFWGYGPEAGQLAGRMKQPGKLWLLWPTGSVPPLAKVN